MNFPIILAAIERIPKLFEFTSINIKSANKIPTKFEEIYGSLESSKRDGYIHTALKLNIFTERFQFPTLIYK